MPSSKDKDQQGAQNHAEGEHGDKTHFPRSSKAARKARRERGIGGAPQNQKDTDVYGRPVQDIVCRRTENSMTKPSKSEQLKLNLAPPLTSSRRGRR
jgi:hypothetical protein